MDNSTNYDFDVAVSFAGEDRSFVKSVVEQVQAEGFTVFYDEDKPAELWGEELTEYFADVYERRARFAVMFISQHYAEKPWARLERRSILVRAMNQASPYLLPVQLDSTSLPGVRSSIGHLDGLREGPGGVAQSLMTRLGTPDSSGERQFNGLVPRVEKEAAVLLGERPPGWEYLLWSYLLIRDIEAQSARYNDFRAGFALPADYVQDADVVPLMQTELAMISATTAMFERFLLGDAQQDAFGPPGTAGDPDLIEHFASSLASIYSELLTWTQRLRGHATQSPEAAELFLALAQYSMQPIGAIRAFAYDLRADMDSLSERLNAGETIRQTRTIKFEIPDVASKRLDRAIKKFGARRR